MADTKAGLTAPVKLRRFALFTQPIQQILIMLMILGLVAAGAWFIHGKVAEVFAVNPWLNGFIVLVFGLGVLTTFWQLWILVQSVSWIEAFVRQEPALKNYRVPRLLAPLAHLLGGRDGQVQPHLQLSAGSARSILDSVAQRIDEARDITRYLANLLVFLGLLGTFFGLATSVPAIVETIRALAPSEGETGLNVFQKLMSGLESQLGGMGTAFSSSLLGLAGSLVVGLLELFAGHGQNRFYRELEEWLSSITQLSFGGIAAPDGDDGAASGAYLAVLDHLSVQMGTLQQMTSEAALGRQEVNAQLAALTQAVTAMTTRMELDASAARDHRNAQTAAILQLVEAQERLAAALTGPDSSQQADAESRMRLRSIDTQLLRVIEEISAGRQESVADIRAELTAITAAVRQLARTGAQPR